MKRKTKGKLLGITLGVVLLGSAPAIMARAEEPAVSQEIFYGDVDGNGTVEGKDVTALRRYLAGGWNVTIDMERADVDANGTIEARDVTTLRRYLAGGWGVVLPRKSQKPSDEEIAINEANFPDSIFRQKVSDQADTDKNGSLSIAEREAVTIISCSGLEAQTDSEEGTEEVRLISSIDGIEYFAGLKELDCSGNQISRMDLSKNAKLEKLKCDDNALTGLDLNSNTLLSELYCGVNLLSELDVSKNTLLRVLECEDNMLKSISLDKNTALEELVCFCNELSSLNFASNSSLVRLDCSNNELTELDLSANSKLIDLDCAENKIKALKMEKNTALERIDCSDNELSELILNSNGELKILFCSGNLLERLDLSGNKKLETLLCYDNQLDSIGLSSNTALTDLDCSGNNISSIDLGSNTQLEYINCEDNDSLTALNLLSNEKLLFVFCDRDVEVHRNVPLSGDIFEDALFLNYVKGFDNNTDGVLSDDEISSVKIIDVSGSDVASLEGIGVFRNLETLKCSNTKLTSLDVSGSRIKSFDAGSNALLLALDCSGTGMQSINVTGSALEELYCSENSLTSLDISSLGGLKRLSCYDNPSLGELSLAKNIELESLECDNCGLNALDLSNNTKLSYLSCDGNNFSELDLSHNPLLKVEE